MSIAEKQLSNSFSTGGGGTLFESHVQASFVALMLTCSYAPCLPCWPITKIKLQGKFAGYDTDDLIVFVTSSGDKQERKMLAQIKHSIRITAGDKVFGEVIQAAWNDFNDAGIFKKNRDVIALITGPLSVTDISDVRQILEWSRSCEDAQEFINKVNLVKFSSQAKKNKLQAFRTQLQYANAGTAVTDEVLFEFMRHFHLLGYDLDIKAGVTLSLLHSLIGQHSEDNIQGIWARLVGEVQDANKNAGTILPDSLPDDLRELFRPCGGELVVPPELTTTEQEEGANDWNQHEYAADFAVAVLAGSWNEDSEGDRKVIEKLANQEYYTWIERIREILVLPDSPLTLKNKQWNVKDRQSLWIVLGPRIFDTHLDALKESVLRVLGERDPQFELQPDERYAASIHGKTLVHSNNLRKGIAECLALCGTVASALVNCSKDKPTTVAVLSVRELLKDADWVLWGSLNNVLPLLAEASPDEFLDVVESALGRTPCPLVELFAQEGEGITGSNYISGLLWGLELLAWDPRYLVSSCVSLGNLAARDPGGQWANRPATSLTEILLPWLPQTLAPMEKRKAAVQTLIKETPMVAWQLLLSLLPNQYRTSSGTHKPKLRKTIPEEQDEGVSHKEYWNQVAYYAEVAVDMASENVDRLSELIDRLDSLPMPSFERVLGFLSSDEVTTLPEDERVRPWKRLMAFIVKHRKFSDAKWALRENLVEKIEEVANKIRPENPLLLYQRLFEGHDSDLYNERGNWQEEQKKVEEWRFRAVEEILSTGGIDSVLQFGASVASPFHVGISLGAIDMADVDGVILPNLLLDKNKKIDQLVSGFVVNRHARYSWEWVDSLDKGSWSSREKTAFLNRLPFLPETWERVSSLLGDAEGEYWSSVNVNAYQGKGDFDMAIDKLIEAGRSYSAISCLSRNIDDKKDIDKKRAVNALLSAVECEESPQVIDSYYIEQTIKFLQDDPSTDSEDLFRVEWAYLPLLDRHGTASPKRLESRLASDPDFFCEVIRLVYRSKKDEAKKKDSTEEEQAIATNAWRLLHEWKTPPGAQVEGTFSKEGFRDWVASVKQISADTGHVEVSLIHLGQVLFYAPSDPSGLWIDLAVAEVINADDADDVRRGYSTGVYNSRGVHWVDPKATPERELAQEYRQKADVIENEGYQRFAVLLRRIADTYDSEAERIISENSTK